MRLTLWRGTGDTAAFYSQVRAQVRAWQDAHCASCQARAWVRSRAKGLPVVRLQNKSLPSGYFWHH
jgi:hypothetical protein